MINRKKYDDIIAQMKKIDKHHPKCNFTLEIEEIENIVNNFDIKLILVGHFNAGKTSLINSFINRQNFLKESQLPQTAIATELIYDEHEEFLAYTLDGEIKHINSIANITPDKYTHLLCKINSASLKKVNDFTIVDTPGFDAYVESHYKALTNYIGLGSAYLVVIDQEKGTLDQTTLNYIQEISNYSNQISILINKCDKITQNMAENIANDVQFTLETYGLPYKVYTISKRDKDIIDKLTNIISNFNAQLSYDNILKQKINLELLNMNNILSVTKNNMYLDTFNFDEQISTYKLTQNNLIYTFKKQRQEANNNLTIIVENVISTIRNAIISKVEPISQALANGNKSAVQAILIETIRPIMINSMKNITYLQIDNITKSLDFSGLDNIKDTKALSDITINLANNLKDLINQGIFTNKDTGNKEKKEKAKSIYRAITGITAIATDFIAPWMEIIIVLLPDIINLINNLFGQSNIEIIKATFINNILPQIINKLYPLITENIKNTTSQIIEEYENALNNKITSIENNIKEIEQKRKNQVDYFEQYKSTLLNDLSLIDNLMHKLEEIK